MSELVKKNGAATIVFLVIAAFPFLLFLIFGKIYYALVGGLGGF